MSGICQYTNGAASQSIDRSIADLFLAIDTEPRLEQAMQTCEDLRSRWGGKNEE